MDDTSRINSAPPIVLIRGLMGDASYWDYFKQLLEQRLQRNVYLLDLTTAFDRDESVHLDEWVERLRQHLNEEFGHRRCHLVSLSLGAVVALNWQQRFPDEVASCTFINAAFIDGQQRWQPQRWWLLIKLAVLTLWPGNRPERWLRWLSAWPTLHSPWPDDKEPPVNVRRLVAQYQILLKGVAFSQPSAPCQLLVSRHDRLVHCSHSYQLAERWQSPLFPHLSAGHDLALDDPRWVCEKITDWVIRHDS
ncbi:alpha/beta fold hydrolase [Celerinatantimonas sp. YJH-8]|uniref:alpha/beta fold hydrolase n=1 Tax=Celerinatantimonas sp. YJH-8 TaxID=3228714 RepID=UPI0038C0B656